MLHYAAVFLIIALTAALLAFADITTSTVGIANLHFYGLVR